ncbi:CRISPR-associated helicase/endonuclease Cas3 [Tepidibacter thalassicus]|uniref:CRISPR-associated helicase Cas3/CRISPR-associated endonuclease Cas3-HD n=1 Tax=Tepidibacter thalassicus DSM 15285 TaxID=1123350 RepID=A0A1M5PU74_9FIRM|nr:CRISPR-associated helicase/endonuclease Cas3 [Tepidibacter thalassicus]SHH05444.1 CRISPR-associated helicase Cas3/CRISPR-associated endonuclease Cas3-HD [Tepidibacter thalassicus DSM 15285]
MKKQILAKSKNKNQKIEMETLIEHIEDLLYVLDKILCKIKFKYIDERVSNTVQINFEKLLRYICILHDLGKMNSKFQQKIELANKIDELSKEENKEEILNLRSRVKNIKDERHNILSGGFLKTIFNDLDIDESLKTVLYKAILLHHGNYEKYLEICESKIEKALLRDVEEGIFLNDEFDIQEIEAYINKSLNINIEFNEQFLDYNFMDELSEDFGGNRDLQYLYIVFKGFLNLIDHLASTQIKEFEYFLPYTKEEIDKKLINNIKEKTNKNNIEFRPMQNKLRELMDENVITEAFTGSGKTAADYRWYGKRKIFLVPNKISAESFYNDAEKILGEENIGILHGDISLYVEDDNSNVNSEGVKTTLRDKTLSRNFAKSYIIATVDQLLLSMFKYPGYEKIFASIYESYITIDEVHLLHPRMYLTLIYFIQFASKYLNTKFHLMTATLPQAYKEKLMECNVDFIESNKDEQVEENRKIELKVLKNDEKVIMKEIEKALKNKCKILIIRNTVDKAIDIFNKAKEKFPQNEINLLHSRFTFEDKKQKYIDILEQKGDIWVSTQAVEISLDLDFQVIISDNAPMESIIQRMGRCNRHDTLEFGTFYILNETEEDVYPKVVKKSTLKQLKELKNKVISMKDRKEELEKYYCLAEIQKYFEDEFQEAERSIKNIYGLMYGELNGEEIIFNYEPYLNIVDNKKEASKLFRNININAKVILESDYRKLEKKRASFKEYQFKSIQISEGYYHKLNGLGALYIEEGYLILRDMYCTYDKERGLEIKNKSELKKLSIENYFL